MATSGGGGTVSRNAIGLDGIEFVEFSSPSPERLKTLFKEFGFTPKLIHKERKNVLFQQGDIQFIVNTEPDSFAKAFCQDHGPCVPSMGWRVKNAAQAFDIAVARGARPAEHIDYQRDGKDIPAIYGIGDSLIYFIEGTKSSNLYRSLGFVDNPHKESIPSKGFKRIDHLTNNVHTGTMQQWTDFYKDIFGFEEIRYFDIRGIKTGLTSFALSSPCGKFCIPINEGTEKKSQINEFLDEYRGAGVQHIAFLTDNLLASLATLEHSSIATLDIDDDYYEDVFTRVPGVREDHAEIKRRNVLVDGDDHGYLLQIFTQNLLGPIFIEMIQRENHKGFGEGNFSALFRAIERDQERRGFLDSSRSSEKE